MIPNMTNIPGFGPKQSKALELLLLGYSSSEAAAIRGVAHQTEKNFRSIIYEKILGNNLYNFPSIGAINVAFWLGWNNILLQDSNTDLSDELYATIDALGLNRNESVQYDPNHLNGLMTLRYHTKLNFAPDFEYYTFLQRVLGVPSSQVRSIRDKKSIIAAQSVENYMNFMYSRLGINDANSSTIPLIALALYHNGYVVPQSYQRQISSTLGLPVLRAIQLWKQ